jgi:transposase-like protein
MPFEQKYTPDTRDASLERVLTRREAEPGNRAIIRETAEEFQVGEQSLRGWIRAHEKANAPVKKVAAEPAAPAAKAAAPVVAAAVVPAASDAAPAAPRRSPGRPSAASTSDARVAELEAEVAKLRRDREALKSALGVLLGD